MIVDVFLVYQFIKKLSTPFENWEAFKYGIIDKDGNILKKRSSLLTRDEKDSFGIFDNLVLKIKKIIGKAPGGESKIASYAAALWLLKEHHSNDVQDITEESIKLFEDAAMNNVGGGNIAGVGIGPDGEPPVRKKRKVLKRNDIIKSIEENNTNKQRT